MDNLKVKIKKLTDNAVIPHYATTGAAGMDLTATWKKEDNDGNVCYGTGLAFGIPEGYAGFLFPRSSNFKKDLLLCNSVGVIDSDYTGEVKIMFKKQFCNPVEGVLYHRLDKEYEVGDRVAQMIFMKVPRVEFDVVDELDKTERGDGGFGHTGK